MPDSLVRYFHINSKDLVYLKFILEAYEGLATLSTEDGKRGIVRISVPCRLGNELEMLMQALRGEIPFRETYNPHALPTTEDRQPWGENCNA